MPYNSRMSNAITVQSKKTGDLYSQLFQHDRKQSFPQHHDTIPKPSEANLCSVFTVCPDSLPPTPGECTRLQNSSIVVVLLVHLVSAVTLGFDRPQHVSE